MVCLFLGPYFFGGFFPRNAILHLISGVMGRPVQNSAAHVVAAGAGFLLTRLFGARQFGRLQGGNSREDSSAH